MTLTLEPDANYLKVAEELWKRQAEIPRRYFGIDIPDDGPTHIRMKRTKIKDGKLPEKEVYKSLLKYLKRQQKTIRPLPIDKFVSLVDRGKIVLFQPEIRFPGMDVEEIAEQFTEENMELIADYGVLIEAIKNR